MRRQARNRSSRRGWAGPMLVIALVATTLVPISATPGYAQTAASSVDVVVGSGGDDVEEQPDGYLYASSSDLELTTDEGTAQTIGLRFTPIDIPTGATITNAWIQFTVDETSTSPAALTVTGIAQPNPPPFSGSFNVTNRPTTTATIEWTPPPWTTITAAGPDQRTPNLTPIIEQIITQPTWSTGNAVALTITGTGSRRRRIPQRLPHPSPQTPHRMDHRRATHQPTTRRHRHRHIIRLARPNNPLGHHHRRRAPQHHRHRHHTRHLPTPPHRNRHHPHHHHRHHHHRGGPGIGRVNQLCGAR